MYNKFRLLHHYNFMLYDLFAYYIKSFLGTLKVPNSQLLCMQQKKKKRPFINTFTSPVRAKKARVWILMLLLVTKFIPFEAEKYNMLVRFNFVCFRMYCWYKNRVECCCMVGARSKKKKKSQRTVRYRWSGIGFALAAAVPPPSTGKHIVYYV